MLDVAACTGLLAKMCARWRHCFPLSRCSSTGLVDYALGAAPYTGAFVIVHEESPLKKLQLAYYKLGDGPFYVFYTPFHLPHIQIASTIGRAFVHHDPTVAPIGGPVCEVVTVAKRDLKAGERLDGVGGFCSYGLIDNATEARAVAALPIGLSADCVLRRDVSKDAVVTFDDVDTPSSGVVGALWREQNKRWSLSTKESEQSSSQLHRRERSDEFWDVSEELGHPRQRHELRSRLRVRATWERNQICLTDHSGRAAKYSLPDTLVSREAGSRSGWIHLGLRSRAMRLSHRRNRTCLNKRKSQMWSTPRSLISATFPAQSCDNKVPPRRGHSYGSAVRRTSWI